jgi:hypothetical protein
LLAPWPTNTQVIGIEDEGAAAADPAKANPATATTNAANPIRRGIIPPPLSFRGLPARATGPPLAAIHMTAPPVVSTVATVVNIGIRRRFTPDALDSTMFTSVRQQFSKAS